MIPEHDPRLTKSFSKGSTYLHSHQLCAESPAPHTHARLGPQTRGQPTPPTFGEESREVAVTLNGQCGSDAGSGPSLGAPVAVPSLERLQDLSTTLSLSFLI